MKISVDIFDNIRYYDPMRVRKNYREEVRIWAERIGVREATRRLVLANMAPTTADQLARGKYKSNPKQDAVDMIEEAMAGFDKDRAS